MTRLHRYGDVQDVADAQRRLDTLLTGACGTGTSDGVPCPNDTPARATITWVKVADRPVPVVTGQDSEVEPVRSIVAGDPYATIDMAPALHRGDEPQVNDTGPPTTA